ncbi:MAG: hypothetical protein ACFFB4_14305 [Promethearchaeota archaeon]
MNNIKKFLNEEEILEYSESYLIKLYKDLNKAIISDDFQSIWELSKTITRYHFKKLYG